MTRKDSLTSSISSLYHKTNKKATLSLICKYVSPLTAFLTRLRSGYTVGAYRRPILGLQSRSKASESRYQHTPQTTTTNHSKLTSSTSTPTSPAFTIVELLIVIVVIGILATIVVVAFNGVQRSAAVAALQSELKQASTKLELAKIDASDGNYPSSLSTIGITDTDTTKFQYTRTTSPTKTYCLTVVNTTQQDLPPYYLSSTNQTPSEGVCEGHSDLNAPVISVGYSSVCALDNSKVYCWGQGRLGNNSIENSSVPVAVNTSGVLAGKTVTSISAGSGGACVVADGRAYCWGSNSNGKLGNGNTVNSTVPVSVDTSGVLANKVVTSISTGFNHTCAVADSKAYCWGTNSDGQLGNGNTNNSSIPVAVNTSGVLADKAVSSVHAGYLNTCVIAESQVYCWGSGTAGRLGNNDTANSSVPVVFSTNGVLAGKTITSISNHGGAHTCVIADGLAYCLGSGSQGQLGNGNTANSPVPVAVDTSGVLAGKTVTSISTGFGSLHTCAVADAGAYCWGFNHVGQLGNNNTTASAVPVAVSTSGVLSGKIVTYVGVGNSSTCAAAGLRVYCWGNNSVGQLGNGNTNGSNVPVLVNTWP